MDNEFTINDNRIIMHRLKSRNKISKSEFIITNLFINYLELELDSDYTLSFMLLPLICNDKQLGYTENYMFIKNIPSSLALFRPIKNEKHANLIIDMFDDLNIIDFDSLEIKEFMKNDKKKYSGYLKKNNIIVEGSEVPSAPSIPILKLSIVAQLLFDSDDYMTYYDNLIQYLKKKR